MDEMKWEYDEKKEMHILSMSVRINGAEERFGLCSLKYSATNKGYVLQAEHGIEAVLKTEKAKDAKARTIVLLTSIYSQISAGFGAFLLGHYAKKKDIV